MMLKRGDVVKLLAENAKDIIYRYRLKPTPGFEYVSPSATDLTGYTPEDHYADPELGLKLVHPDDKHILEAFLRSPESANKVLTLRWISRDGRVLWTGQFPEHLHLFLASKIGYFCVQNLSSTNHPSAAHLVVANSAQTG